MQETDQNVSGWLIITTPDYCKLQGLESLIAAAEAEGVTVQNKKEHLPAACTGLEFIAELFININLVDILRDGLIYSAATGLLKKLASTVVSFFKKNRHSDFDPVVRIHLNDITFILHGTFDQPEIGNTINKLAEVITELEANNIADITHIERINSQFSYSELLQTNISNLTAPELVIRYSQGSICRHPLTN